MNKILVSIACAVLLTSCATPSQKCVLDANADLRAARNDIKELQATVDRGYGLRQITQYVPVRSTCERTNGQRSVSYACTQYEFRTQEVRYSVDLPALRGKLDLLKAQLPAIQAKADAAVAQCEAVYNPTP